MSDGYPKLNVAPGEISKAGDMFHFPIEENFLEIEDDGVHFPSFPEGAGLTKDGEIITVPKSEY